MLFKFKFCRKLSIFPDICLLNGVLFSELSVYALGSCGIGDSMFLFTVCGHSV